MRLLDLGLTMYRGWLLNFSCSCLNALHDRNLFPQSLIRQTMASAQVTVAETERGLKVLSLGKLPLFC